VFIKLFKSNSPFSIVLLPVLMAICWAHAFIYPTAVNVDHCMPLYRLVLSWMQPFPLIAAILGFVLMVLTGFLYNYIVNEHEFLPKRTYLPGLFYCLLMSSSSLLQFHPLLFANFFIVLMLNSLINTYRKNTAFNGVFEGGLFLGIASLFYFPIVFLLPVLLISLIVLRPFIWREWLIAILGFMFPYIYVIIFYFWNDSLDFFWNDRVVYFLLNGKLYYGCYWGFLPSPLSGSAMGLPYKN